MNNKQAKIKNNKCERLELFSHADKLYNLIDLYCISNHKRKLDCKIIFISDIYFYFLCNFKVKFCIILMQFTYKLLLNIKFFLFLFIVVFYAGFLPCQFDADDVAFLSSKYEKFTDHAASVSM